MFGIVMRWKNRRRRSELLRQAEREGEIARWYRKAASSPVWAVVNHRTTADLLAAIAIVVFEKYLRRSPYERWAEECESKAAELRRQAEEIRPV
jgi:hypothetical protein